MCKNCEPFTNMTHFETVPSAPNGDLLCKECGRVITIQEQEQFISDYLDAIDKMDEEIQHEYDRITQWLEFSKQIQLHIEQYTKPQYGNEQGNEQADSFTVEDCFKNMERYMNRRKANTRGNTERLRDILKITHYACFAYYKLREELGEEDVYHELG